MLNVSIARRYARALLEVAGPAADEVSQQLETISDALTKNPELLDVISNPTYSGAQRLAVVENVFKLVGTPHVALINTVKLLNDRNRLAVLPGIARLFRDMVDVKLGRLRGKVMSAKELPADQLKKLEESLEALTQRDVVLETGTDKALIGGVTAQVGPFLYDGSLRTQLDELKQTLGGNVSTRSAF